MWNNILLISFSPEIFLSFAILSQLLINAYIVTHKDWDAPILDLESFYQTFFTLSCVLLLLLNSQVNGFFLNFLFLNDISTQFLKILTILSSLLSLPAVLKSFIVQKLNFFEFFVLFLMANLALLLLISACDMLTVYLTLELQALTFYILATFKRDSIFSSEAGLKYFMAGAYISGIFLFGCSLIYGTLGTLNFHNLILLLHFPFDDYSITYKPLILIGILFITIALLFKLGIAPFHFWIPDVYEGAPLASTIVFTIIPKIALFSLLIKWISVILPLFFEFQSLFIFCGILTIIIGSLFALRQKRVKRLIIYSSITQMGFLIITVSLYTIQALTAVYFYLIIYIITLILIWTHVSFFYESKVKTFEKLLDPTEKLLRPLTPLYITDLSNLRYTNKPWAYSLAFAFFSMGALPPFSGFWAKFFLFESLINNNLYIIAVLLILLSVISVFYYIRIVKIMFFEKKQDEPIEINDAQNIYKDTPLFVVNCIFMITLVFLIFFFFLYPNILLAFCHNIVLGSTFL